MRLLNAAPINRKLIVIIMLTCGLALLLSAVAIVISDTVLYRASIRHDLNALAEIIAGNSTAALAFENPQDAQETLATLRARPFMVQACIYTVDSRVFAQYVRAGDVGECPQADEADSERIAGGSLSLRHPILLNGRKIGSVYFQYELGEIASRQKLYSTLVGAIALGSMLLALFFSSRLRRLISGPIAHLAWSARTITETKDYSIRAVKQTDDELGLLVDSFNEMLGNIQQRDDELIKARDELEQRVAERTAQLETVNKELEAFTYSVAHDLRAPLRHIDGFSSILEEECGSQLDPAALQYLGRIRQGTRQMGELVDDLLNLSRISRQEIRRQATGLNSLVEEARGDLKEMADQRGVKRDVEWRIAPLPFVDCDPVLIKQVFANLLSNAVKYTRPRDHAVIEVGTLNTYGLPGVYVRDNGVGFSMKYADKLFGVFQRLHRQEDFEGTGIGLATVQRIINKHGGRIWAEAELDKGATFYFTLGAEKTAQ